MRLSKAQPSEIHRSLAEGYFLLANPQNLVESSDLPYFEKARVGIVLLDREGRVVESNGAFQEMLGYSTEELSGILLTEITHPEDTPTALGLFQDLMSGRRDFYEMERRYLHRDGRLVWGHLAVSRIKAERGQPEQAVAIMEDTTARRDVEELAQTLFFTSPMGVYLIQDKRFLLVNQSFQNITGYSQKEMWGKEKLRLILPRDQGLVKKETVKMLKGERTLPYEYRIIAKDGATKWIRESVTANQYQGRPATLGFFTDISQRKRTEEALKHWIRKYHEKVEKLKNSENLFRDMSRRDSLTGLWNYREFYRRLGEELERSRRYGRSFCLLMLDLDHFKEINDTFGHLVGDETLCSVAALIKEEVRTVDQVARYGGEEFAVILPETSHSGGGQIAERIREVIETQKITCASGASVNVTVSIGIAAFPKDGFTEEGLVAAADEALYTAKRSGRNRVAQADNGKS